MSGQPDPLADPLAEQRKRVDAMLVFFLGLLKTLAIGGAVIALGYGWMAGTAVRSEATHAPSASLDDLTTWARGASALLDSATAGLIALAISGAAAAVGAGAGFLFGLPRTLTSNEVGRGAAPPAVAGASATSAPPPSGGGAVASSQTLGTNTNLEQISDWLTKIIVGVGLTRLDQLPGAIEGFGERTALEFGAGGKVFGVAAGLYFLIIGFFVGYILTRTKLTWMFVGSAREASIIDKTYADAVPKSAAEPIDPMRVPLGANTTADTFVDSPQTRSNLYTDSIRPSVAAKTVPATTPMSVVEADEAVLDRSIIAVNSQQELAARAAAEARAGRVAVAAALYAQVVRDDPASPYLVDYAAVLGLLGSRFAATQIVARVGRAFPARQDEARRKMLVGLLRAGLYNNNFEDAIAAGEELIARPDEADDAWARLWLACALGQRHARLKSANADDPALVQIANRAADLLEQAVKLDPGKIALIRTLYDPALQQDGDDDLQSLRPNARIEALLGGRT